MNALCCSVCGLEGVRLYRPLAGEEHPDFVRCNAHVPDERPALLGWVPYVQEALVQLPCLRKLERELLAFLALPEATQTPVWTGRFGWIDIENAPGAA